MHHPPPPPKKTVERNIRILNVGRIDSNLHDLQDYQIPAKVIFSYVRGKSDLLDWMVVYIVLKLNHASLHVGRCVLMLYVCLCIYYYCPSSVRRLFLSPLTTPNQPTKTNIYAYTRVQ